CVGGLPGFGEDAPVGVEDHGFAGANLIVIHTDAVAEDKEQAVVMGATGQPAHEPAAAFVAAKFAFDSGGIGVAIIPNLAVNNPHQVRVFAAHGAGLVGRDQNVGSAQGSDTDVFNKIAVIANQHAD